MEETKKMEQPERKMIKVTIEKDDGLQEFEGKAVVVFVLTDDGTGVNVNGKIEGCFSNECLAAMQDVLEKEFPEWVRIDLVRRLSNMLKKASGEDKEEDAEAPESDPAE